jgi:FMN-dependent NADH-azoreductase
METQTTTQRLADVLLDGKLSEFVSARRAKNRSWRLIARDLYEQTGIDLTYETLRRWYPDDDESPDVQEKRTA